MRSKLPELLAAKSMTRYRLCAETGLSPNTVDRMYKNRLDRLDIGTVSTLVKFFGLRTLDELIVLEDS